MTWIHQAQRWSFQVWWCSGNPLRQAWTLHSLTILDYPIGLLFKFTDVNKPLYFLHVTMCSVAYLCTLVPWFFTSLPCQTWWTGYFKVAIFTIFAFSASILKLNFIYNILSRCLMLIDFSKHFLEMT